MYTDDIEEESAVNGSAEEEGLLRRSEGTPSQSAKASRASSRGSTQETQGEMGLKRWCFLTGLILGTTFTISLFIDDLSIVLGFVGSIGSTTISFILPGILYATLHREDTSKRRMRRFAQVLATWGILVLIVTFTANLMKVLRAGNSLAQSHGDRVKALLDAHAGEQQAAAAAAAASAAASTAAATVLGLPSAIPQA